MVPPGRAPCRPRPRAERPAGARYPDRMTTAPDRLLAPAARLAAVVLLAGLWSSYPTLAATYVRDHLDARAFGSAYGTMTIAYGVTAMVAPAAVGILADRFDGFTVPYLAVAALALLGMVILASVPRRSPVAVEHRA